MDYEDKKSRFNAGIALMERIDSLQRAINASRFNPLMRNPETGTFNYEVMISSAEALISEGWDKFNPEEKKLMLRMHEVARNLTKYYSPVSLSRGGDIVVHKDNYEKLIRFFEIYERKIKEVYGKHNLNAPDAEDDEGL